MEEIFADLGESMGGRSLLPLLLLSSNRELMPLQTVILAVVPERLTGDPRFQDAPDRPADHPDLLAGAIDALVEALPGRRRHGAGYAGLVAAMASRSGLSATAGLEAERALLGHYHVTAARHVAAAIAGLDGWQPVERRALECVLRIALLRKAKRRALGARDVAEHGPRTAAPREEPTPSREPATAADAPWATRAIADLRSLASASLGRLPDLNGLYSTVFPPCTILIAGRRGSGRATLAQAITGAARREVGTEPLVELPTGSTSLRLLALDLDAEDAGLGLLHATLAGHKPDAAWLCIDEQKPSLGATERAYARALEEAGVPVLVALTKGWSTRPITPAVERIFARARAVHRVVATARFGEDGRLVAAAGLNRLVADTLRHLPARKRHAFAAAQDVLWEPRLAAARAVMRHAVAAAATVAATPIPFADAVVLVPIQIAMLLGISRALGLALDQAAARSVAAAALGCSATTLGGRALASALANVVKLVPGLGTVVGGAVNSVVAGSLTRMLGEAYVEFVTATLGRTGRLPDVGAIIAHLKGSRRPAA